MAQVSRNGFNQFSQLSRANPSFCGRREENSKAEQTAASKMLTASDTSELANQTRS